MKWQKLSRKDLGSVCKKTKFLFLPKCLNDDCRWLERVTIVYVVEKSMADIEGLHYTYEWVANRWVDD